MRLVLLAGLSLALLVARPAEVRLDAFYAQGWLLAHDMFRAPGMAPKLGGCLKRVDAGDEPGHPCPSQSLTIGAAAALGAARPAA
jgi:hypothetical protein